MALEKVMKLYLIQHSIQPGQTHKLDKLRDLAASHGLLVPKDPRFLRLPTDKQAIAHRYAEPDPRLPAIALKDYRTVVSLIRAYCGAMKRTLTMKNARLLLKKPPWFRFSPLQ